MHPPGRSRSLRACAVLPGRVKLNPKLKPIVEGSSRFQNIAIISGITNMVKATHQYDVTSVPRRQAIYRSEPIYPFWHFSSLCVFLQFLVRIFCIFCVFKTKKKCYQFFAFFSLIFLNFLCTVFDLWWSLRSRFIRYR